MFADALPDINTEAVLRAYFYVKVVLFGLATFHKYIKLSYNQICILYKTFEMTREGLHCHDYVCLEFRDKKN